ncbi:unnamed protein product [Timema podura]|uniref:Uncharacterized protein n=1 Tax=Timema podura TaxID=61482 RepID=A0ABN7NP56_TIMPD|nr:unnamed protein product [Timema podura]
MESDLGETILSTHDRDLCPNLPVIGCIVYCECDTLNNLTNEIQTHQNTPQNQMRKTRLPLALICPPKMIVSMEIHVASWVSGRFTLPAYPHPSLGALAKFGRAFKEFGYELKENDILYPKLMTKEPVQDDIKPCECKTTPSRPLRSAAWNRAEPPYEHSVRFPSGVRPYNAPRRTTAPCGSFNKLLWYLG